MSDRPQNKNLKRGGQPGRLKGIPNKATQEVREISQRLVCDEKYQKALALRIMDGTAGRMEEILWYYAFGKPKETVDLNANVSDERITARQRILDELARLAGPKDPGEGS